MNVHSIVNRAVRSVNPNVLVTIRVSTGSVTNDDGSRSPAFNQVQRWAQVQPVTTGDIRMIEGQNLQADYKHIWINGHVDGLVRGQRKGGDFVFLPDGTAWKIVQVLESWPDWCSAIMVLQVQ